MEPALIVYGFWQTKAASLQQLGLARVHRTSLCEDLKVRHAMSNDGQGKERL